MESSNSSVDTKRRAEILAQQIGRYYIINDYGNTKSCMQFDWLTRGI